LLDENKNTFLNFYESYQGVLLTISYELQAEVISKKNSYQSTEPKKLNIFVPVSCS